MLTYRLYREVALVLVSAVTMAEDGSSFFATVEYMQKISADDKASLLKSLQTEWKSVLLEQPPEAYHPQTLGTGTKREILDAACQRKRRPRT